MRWVVGRVLSPVLFVIAIVFLILHGVGRGASKVFGLIASIARVCSNFAEGVSEEIRRFHREGRTVTRDITIFSEEQRTANPLAADKETMFLLITCGQAARNFLLSDVLSLLRARFNVVILSPYAYSQSFRSQYSVPGVHVLPWFESFRTLFERAFQYYFMGKSCSRTHQSWLANLEARAKCDPESASVSGNSSSCGGSRTCWDRLWGPGACRASTEATSCRICRSGSSRICFPSIVRPSLSPPRRIMPKPGR